MQLWSYKLTPICKGMNSIFINISAMDIYVVKFIWLLLTMQQWAQGYAYLFKLVFLYFLCEYSELELYTTHALDIYIISIIYCVSKIPAILNLRTYNCPTHIGDLPSCINFWWMGSLALFFLCSIWWWQVLSTMCHTKWVTVGWYLEAEAQTWIMELKNL